MSSEVHEWKHEMIANFGLGGVSAHTEFLHVEYMVVSAACMNLIS